MDRDELIAKLAAVIAGLQVPMSMGGPITLGAAYDPLVAIRNARSFPWGWASVEEVQQFLREMLVP